MLNAVGLSRPQATGLVCLPRKSQTATTFWLLFLGVRQSPALGFASFKISIVGSALNMGFPCASFIGCSVRYTCCRLLLRVPPWVRELHLRPHRIHRRTGVRAHGSLAFARHVHVRSFGLESISKPAVSFSSHSESSGEQAGHAGAAHSSQV